ncbi:MAG: glycosyltransferase [Methanobrevibacter sp.]|nr:glycosyltransferase [Methanobrevibacter sp.]
MLRKIKRNHYLYILLKSNFHFKELFRNIKGYNTIKNSNLFNSKYYNKKYPDVKKSKMNPIIHYMYYGYEEKKNPSKTFCTDFYLSTYNDVKVSGLNPLIHYYLHGRNEKRSINSNEEIKEKKKIIQRNYVLLSSPKFTHSPLVSIIILNKNGITNLKRLFKNFEENIVYPNYEIIIVDNASTDKSIQFLEEISERLPLKIIKNNENKNFSKGNNQGYRESNGEYLVLLNNDIETTYGWLNEMMGVILNNDNVGSVGAKLAYPKYYDSKNKKNSFKVQHAGIAFKTEGDNFRPYNIGNGEDIFHESIKTEIIPGVTAAALLIKKSVYEEVNGLCEEYIYGFEDVDLGLKLFKKGYSNMLCSTALLFHHESSTQKKDNSNNVSKRRKTNFRILNKKWKSYLFEKILEEKLKCEKLLTKEILTIGIIVTEMGPTSKAGDAFTALEISKELINLGYNVRLISRDEKLSNPNLDIVINLLYDYDISSLNLKENTIKMVWMRNRIEQWVKIPEIHDYDIYLASSKKACDYVSEFLNKKVFLFPIATNPDRFEKATFSDEYQSDYCFTGNYWGVKRDIIDFLEPDELGYNFAIYGNNWHVIEKFEKHDRGFIEYMDIPNVYASTKIVIDDAVNVTKEQGSVNSRVFDAIAAKKLVITSGTIGSEDTFNGLIPSFNSKEELHNLLSFYLENDQERISKINELNKMVLEHHTYKQRALELKNIFKYGVNEKLKFLNNPSISIKISVTRENEAKRWGDYHFALALKKEFRKKYHSTKIFSLKRWYDEDYSDIIIVLRGLSKYETNSKQFNIMWNISHPDLISIDELNDYDHVFISSNKFAEEINKKTNVPVSPLLQCTDTDLFFPEESDEYKHELLFVGNSKNTYRQIIKDLLPIDYEFGLYGKWWERFIPKKYITGGFIPNNELHKAYSSCKILLNDHWKDMAKNGFISNRIFDGFASGAFIISDKVEGVKELFGETLPTYSSREELHKLIDYYMENEQKRKEKAKTGREIVLNNHTFAKRTEEILDVINKNFKNNK